MKKAIIIALFSLILMNQIGDFPDIKGQTINSTKLEQQTDKQSKQVIYVQGGEGSMLTGDGTKEYPYQNIRKALQEVEDGGVIKLMGRVLYTDYEIHPTNLSALPLVIDKNITLEGESGDINSEDGIYTRAPIQLAANVTFKNMRLQMVNNNVLMPGVPPSAPTPADNGIYKSGRTIYTAGYTLTIDNVNTRIGTSIDQVDDRPFISGGTYQDRGVIGSKSIVNIVNANEETRFNTIYAGDYWIKRSHPFELNLDSTLGSKTILDKTIHTGGIIPDYTGDVTINMNGSLTGFTVDPTNHSGSVDINLGQNAKLFSPNFKQVHQLTLDGNTFVELSSDSLFDVTNLSIKDNALLDFRKLPGNPQLQGDLTGAISSNQSTVETGAIVLRNDQTLEVTGVATGAIRLNDHQRLTWQPLKRNHPYLIDNQASTATLIINPKNGQEELGLYVQEEMTEDGLKTYHLEGETSQTFKSFKWNGGETQLINPIAMEEYLFPVQYINEFDEEYIPDDLGNFKLSFIKHSQNDLEVTEDDDMDLSVYFDFDGNVIIAFIYKYPDPDDPNSGELDLKDYEGDLTIKLEHVPTGSVITKMITVLRSQENESIPHLTGSVELSDTLKVGDTLTATTKDFPQNAERLKYRWLVDGQEVYDGTEQTLELKEDYVGKSIQVEVRASNYIGSVSSSEKTVLTNKLQGTVRIEGTPRQGETLQAVVENAQTSQLKYQWLMDNQEISGATSATLELKPEHVGHIISVVVTADDYIEHLSTSTTRVLLPELTGTLTLTGTPKIGETLIAELSGLPAGMQNITYQWFADRTEIPGATASTFVVTKEYSGQVISVEVRASNYDGRLLSQEVLVLGHLDLNNDGVIDEKDLELLATLYQVTSQDSEWNEKFDLNEDGIIDLYDIVKISTKMNK